MQKSLLKLPLLITMLLWSTLGYTQSKSNPNEAKHEIKTWTDADGKIYWNLKLPVYLTISSSPQGEKYPLKQVKNAKMESYADPMYFDGHGVHYITHNDFENPIPEHEVSFAVFADGLSTKSSLALEGAPKFVSDQLYFGKGLKGVLTATDQMSGVDKIYYTLGSAEYKTYVNALDFSGEKAYSLSYYGVDKVGNVEQLNTKDFFVDTSAPTTQHEIGGENLNNILSPRSTLTLTAVDKAAGVNSIRYIFDGNTEKSFQTTVKLNSLGEGEHTVKYYATDNVKNEENQLSYSFYMDKTAPAISSEIKGDYHQANEKTYISDRSQLMLKAEDNKAGLKEIYLSINGKKEELYTGPVAIDGVQGNYTIKYRAIDKVNNTTSMIADKTVGNGVVFMDKTPPTISYSYNGEKFFARDTMFITSATKITLTAKDFQSGVQKINYTLDSESPADYTTAFSVAETGRHTVTYKGFDNVNNESTDDFLFVIDNDGPEIFPKFSIDNVGVQQLKDRASAIPIYPKQMLVYLAATDAMVGIDKIYYAIDGGAEKVYTGPIQMNQIGLRTIAIKAVDKLGNTTEADLLEFVIQ